MKTSELTGAALDWAVAKCEGADELHFGDAEQFLLLHSDPIEPMYHFCDDWAQGGPIIEREGMHVDCLRVADHYRPAIWEAWPYATGTKHIQQAPTPLIAAMRCYVASKLGDIVDIPAELLA